MIKFIAAALIALSICSSTTSEAQCNTNISICTPGVAGPFGFAQADPNPSSCLDYINGQTVPNYAYIILYITQSGDLNLLIQGDQPTGCLDVSIFDITGQADPCNSLSTGTEIGCNYASNCDGCNEFGSNFPCMSEVPAPVVTAGDVIMILVEDWSDVMTNFTLELSNVPGSAQTGPPDPTITPVGPFCTTDAAVQLNAVNNGGTWSGPGVSATGLFDPSSLAPGTYTINYDIGAAPCDANDATTITVQNCQTLTASNPAPINVQCPGDVPAPDPLVVIDEAGPCNPTVAFLSETSDGQSCPETITRIYRVSNTCGDILDVTQIITVNDTQAPVFNIPPANVTVQCQGDVPGMIDLGWTDNCDGTGLATGTDVSDGQTCPETITRTWTYTDACGNTTSVSQTITVNDTQAPTANIPAAVTVECIGDVPVANINAVTGVADNCTVNPVVVWVGDVSDGQSCPETIVRTYSITDDCGNVTTVDQQIVVDDITPPTASNATPISIPGGMQIPNPDPLVITDEADNCTVNPVVAWVSDVSNNGACPEIITRTFSVTDDCGNQILVTQSISIGDPIQPTASNPLPVNVECIADVPAPDPLVVTDEADNGALPPVVTFENDVSDGQSCPETITRTYRVTDDCGNFIFVTQTITVNDVTPPTANIPAPINVECIGDVPASDITVVPNAADNCTQNPTIAWVGDVSDGLMCPETITRTYSITDDCGNSITVDQQIVVNDVTPPTASNPTAIAVPGPQDVPNPDPTVVTNEADNCTANPVVAWVSDASDGNVCNGEIITRTYSITDDCGNQSTVTQEIMILATAPPLDAGPDQTVCLGDLVTITPTNPTNATLTWTPAVPTGAFAANQTETYYVSATANGCTSEDSITITVETAPVVSFSADNLSGCAPLTVVFTNNSISSSSLSNCEWTIDGQTLTGCNNVSYTFQNSGTYDISLTTTSGAGCTTTETYSQYIYVEANPIAAFTASQTEISSVNSTINFNNTSTGATSYSWDFGDNSASSEENPSHNFSSDGSGGYTVVLTATSPNGCTDVTSLSIQVAEELIYYVPNTFTPDEDEFNELFRPIFTEGYDPQDFTMILYNRWGEIIWESYNDTVGWNGTYGADGKRVQDGTYVWVIEFKTLESDERVKISGHVNVIR